MSNLKMSNLFSSSAVTIPNSDFKKYLSFYQNVLNFLSKLSGIPYFLCYETLLNWKNLGTLDPYSDTFSVGIIDRDISHLWKTSNLLYSFKEEEYGYCYTFDDSTKIKIFVFNEISIDYFVRKDHVHLLKPDNFTYEMLFPVLNEKKDGILIRYPSDFSQILRKTYGNKYFEKIILLIDEQRKTIPLTEDNKIKIEKDIKLGA